MIVITMIDGQRILVKNDTILVGMNNLPSNDKEFYLSQNYIGNIVGDFEKDGSKLSTIDKRLGIGGFILSHEIFSVGEGNNKPLYFTSAVKSIEIE